MFKGTNIDLLSDLLFKNNFQQNDSILLLKNSHNGQIEAVRTSSLSKSSTLDRNLVKTAEFIRDQFEDTFSNLGSSDALQEHTQTLNNLSAIKPRMSQLALDDITESNITQAMNRAVQAQQKVVDDCSSSWSCVIL